MSMCVHLWNCVVTFAPNGAFTKSGDWLAALSAFSIVFLGYSVLGQDSICARVKIEILQELTLERQAFEARMTINNGLTGVALDNIKVDINFADRNGNTVRATTNPNDLSAKFFWRLQTGSQIPTTISGGTSNRITWLIIPAPGAAGPNPQGELYFVGATLTYRVAGEEQVVQVSPDSIIVKPMPTLVLDYFLPSEVYGDDPFTQTFVEPVVPFSLGVRVRNVGFGTAYKLKIESAQPRIIENELGLAIDFRIDGSEVNGRPATTSLLADFGDILPNRAGVARWIMISTLSGRFVEFTANYTHADELGGQLTSFITNAPRTHFLVRDVLVDLPGRDGVRDFLALDGNVMRVYESDVTDDVVQDQSATASISGSGLTRVVNSAPTAGFSFIKLPDPFGGGQILQSARRADGKQMNAANAWLSKTFDRNARRWDYFVNVFDANNVSGLSYTFQFGDAPPLTNRPPRLDPISNWTISPDDTVSFPVTAFDPDGNALSFTLLGTVTNGATLNSSSGAFLWRPTTAQAGTTNVFTVRVSDSGSPTLTDTTNFVIVVRAINHPPVIAGIPNKVVNEGSLLSFTVTATDSDSPAQLISYSLAPGSPVGAQINATNGVFTWVPNEAQGPTTNTITILASDSGQPSKTGSNTVQVIVNEVNSPPVLVALAPQTANVLVPFRVTNIVIDPDIPANRMTFTLGTGAPAGSRINATNGIFSWTPSRTDNFSTNSVTIVVSDNGQPALGDSESFLVLVNDFLELTLGQAILRVQETGRVSVTLFSRNGLTNLSFAVAMPTNRLVLPGIEPLSPAIRSATVQAVPPWLYVNISTFGGQVLQGTQQIAALTFTAVSNRSAFVPVPLTNVTARRPGGSSVPRAIANDGRVVVLGEEPLLEAKLASGKRDLILYGHPGNLYSIEQTTFGLPIAWEELNQYRLSDFSRVIEDIPQGLSLALYRAVRQASATNALTIRTETDRLVIEWPLAYEHCQVEQTPSLTPPVVWTPAIISRQRLADRFRVEIQVGAESRLFRLACESVQACVTAPTGMIAWWPGDGNARDVIGTNHGVQLNGAGFAPGKVGSGFHFDGVDDYINVGPAPALQFAGTAPFSFSFWIAPEYTGSPADIITRLDAGAGVAWELYTSHTHDVGFWTRAVAEPQELTSTPLVPYGSFTHVVMSFDGSTKRIFLNGVLNASLASAPIAPFNSEDTDVLIGVRRILNEPYFPNAFKGVIDEVMVFDRALTADEIKAIHSAGNLGVCKP